MKLLDRIKAIFLQDHERCALCHATWGDDAKIQIIPLERSQHAVFKEYGCVFRSTKAKTGMRLCNHCIVGISIMYDYREVLMRDVSL